MHSAHAQSFHQQVCHREICQTTGAGQNKSSLHILLLRGTYIMAGWGFMVLDTVHLKAECILAHLRELGSMVYCIAFGKNHMLQTTWAWMCTKIDLCSRIDGDLCSKSVKWERKVTFILGASNNTVVLNVNSTVSVPNTLLPESGRAEHILTLRQPSSELIFSIHLVSAGKEHFILPEINHSSSDWPLCGAVILKGSWPVKADLFQMSTGPQRCPDVNSLWWEKLARKRGEIYHQRWNLAVPHKLNLSSAHYPALF